MAMLQRRFASSIYAARRSLERMRDKRKRILEDPQAYRQEQINKKLPEDYEDLTEEEQQDNACRRSISPALLILLFFPGLQNGYAAQDRPNTGLDQVISGTGGIVQ